LIIAVSSVAGFSPLIARTGYAASKHALHGFFDSLRSELQPDGVDVMIVCPHSSRRVSIAMRSDATARPQRMRKSWWAGGSRPSLSPTASVQALRNAVVYC
jgi:short-subunit dehydrogenase